MIKNQQNAKSLKKLQPNKTETVFLENWTYEAEYVSEWHMIKMTIVFWNFRKLLSQVTNKFGKVEAHNRAHKLEVRKTIKNTGFAVLAK